MGAGTRAKSSLAQKYARVMAYIVIPMETATLVNGLKISLKVMELIFSKQANASWEHSKMARKMVMAYLAVRMAVFIGETLSMIKRKEKENANILVDKYTRDIGKTTSDMVLECLSIDRARNIVEVGNTIKSMGKVE
jgi:hypothetical protein